MEESVKRLAVWELNLDLIPPNRKVFYGGFGWLNAMEWGELIEMHIRNHLRQKEELESYV